ncbi:MAG TPA: hypothetical protein VKR06_26560 [Ktedonosporobacter sp.]|nr:hypothetical protein [Ktedonosporobacter sp.]
MFELLDGGRVWIGKCSCSASICLRSRLEEFPSRLVTGRYPGAIRLVTGSDPPSDAMLEVDNDETGEQTAQRDSSVGWDWRRKLRANMVAGLLP